MLSLEEIEKNNTLFRDKLFNAYFLGFNDSPVAVIKKLQENEEKAFKTVHTLIYECGKHDKKYNLQQAEIARERRKYRRGDRTEPFLVKISYLFIGEDLAINQGMQELKSLVKKELNSQAMWIFKQGVFGF